MKEFLSERGCSNVKAMPPLVQAHFDAIEDMYNPETNVNGYINMGTAETHLIDHDIIELLKKIQNRMELVPKNLHYDYFQGSVEFRTAIANYWQNIIFVNHKERKITAEQVAIGAGCSLALEMLATMLGDPGDVILVPAPYYSGFVDDFNERAQVLPVGVHCGENLEIEAFEAAYKEQTSLGKKVCGVLFSSPNNPIGTVYKPEEIEGLINFCIKHDLDIISDEIYAQTIHNPDTTWVSTLDLVPDMYLHRVHVTSSFAKDFALSGFRTGFAISFNPDIINGMKTLAYFSAVSTHTQAILTSLLEAPELPSLLKKNKEELRASYLVMKKSLSEMNIPIAEAQGGIFIWADFRQFLTENTFEEETRLWEKIYKNLKINISPGQLFGAKEPGWFRICYAQEAPFVEEACKRLQKLK